MEKLQDPKKKDIQSGLTDSAFSDDGSSEALEGISQSESSDDDSEEESGAEVKEEDSDPEQDEEITVKSESESSEDNEDTSAFNWKSNLAQKAADAFVERQNTTANLWKLVYGEFWSIHEGVFV